VIVRVIPISMFACVFILARIFFNPFFRIQNQYAGTSGNDTDDASGSLSADCGDVGGRGGTPNRSPLGVFLSQDEGL
jgi:hypothetical protein